MSAKDYFNLFFSLNFVNKLRLTIFSQLTLIYKLFRIKLVKKLRIKIFNIEYELTVGMGELNTIFHTNLLRDYFQVDGFAPTNSDVCVDVGANIGSTSLVWAKNADKGKIFAVEPHPDTYTLLVKNIEINKASNKIFPRQFAVGASDGDVVLFVSDEGTMAMKPDNYKWKGREVTVTSITLDSFMKNEKISTIDILKIDIEGFEGDALDGAMKTLQRTKRVVLEYHSAELRKKCLEILSQNGFESHEKGSLIFSWKS